MPLWRWFGSCVHNVFPHLSHNKTCQNRVCRTSASHWDCPGFWSTYLTFWSNGVPVRLDTIPYNWSTLTFGCTDLILFVIFHSYILLVSSRLLFWRCRISHTNPLNDPPKHRREAAEQRGNPEGRYGQVGGKSCRGPWTTGFEEYMKNWSNHGCFSCFNCFMSCFPDFEQLALDLGGLVMTW